MTSCWVKYILKYFYLAVWQSIEKWIFVVEPRSEESMCQFCTWVLSEIRSYSPQLSNLKIATTTDRGNVLRHVQTFIKDHTKVTSWVWWSILSIIYLASVHGEAISVVWRGDKDHFSLFTIKLQYAGRHPMYNFKDTVFNLGYALKEIIIVVYVKREI